MKKVVYKYPVTPDASINISQGAQILCVAMQHDQPCIWALVDPNAPTETRHFVTIPTGKTFDPSNMEYIGTFHGVEGWMVFHLFEVKS